MEGGGGSWGSKPSGGGSALPGLGLLPPQIGQHPSYSGNAILLSRNTDP